MGTLRAGGRESQSRKEQFRWKMGTAPGAAGVGPAKKEARVGCGSAKSAGAAGGMACHSWLDAKRSGAGVMGERSPEGRAQQAGMAQVSACGLQQ